MSPDANKPLDMARVKIDPLVALSVPAVLARRRRALAFARVEGKVLVACANPEDSALLRAIQRQFREPVELLAADPQALQGALDRTYGDEGGARSSGGARRSGGMRRSGGEGEDAVSLCEDLLRAAVLRQASDVHLDPEREGVRVRFRVDGVLEDYSRLGSEVMASVLSRFKVLSDMDIAERRAPQDGRFSFEYREGKKVELRTATLPTQHGERLTLRLLALETEALTLERLGMDQAQRDEVQTQIHKPHGLFLVTGPTGSGKSTTLYAALRHLVAERPVNVITVEDPIEFDIQGVAQAEVDSGDKASFSRLLRSILRHDPDVLMIGEIRDGESADVALKAALTGHLVFSTLHTNSAPGAVTRLADLGVERFLIAATLRLALAQRLVRRLCESCRTPRALEPAEAEALGIPAGAELQVFEPKGCLYCAGRGYVGRAAVFELLPAGPELAARIVAGDDEGKLLEHMSAAGLPTLVQSARARLEAGTTSVAEALSAVTVW